MLKKIDHHMLYMSNRQNANNSALTFRQNIESGRSAVSRLDLDQQKNDGRGAGVHISSLRSSKRELQQYSIQAHPYNNFSLKPLQDYHTRVSFKGFNISRLFEPVVEEIPSSLTSFVRKSIKEISTEQSSLYDKFIKEFIEAAKSEDGGFRKYLGISKGVADKLDENNLIKIPKRSLLQRTFSVLVSPITMFKDLALWALDNNLGKKLLPSLHAKIQKTKAYDRLVANYKGIVGLSNFTRIQENNYRRMSGHGDWLDGKDMIIPQDILKEKLIKQKLRSVDPEKGQYSAKHLMLGNRLVSGTVYAGFLSNDAYNTTMRYSNDENASQEQRASRAKQEVAKIGMNMYIHNLLLSMFESQINKSMLHALLASGVTVAAAEVMGRMLVGRPIFPSNKENLDRMEQKMQNNKGVMAAVGRLIAGDKRNTAPKKQEKQEPLSTQTRTSNAFGSFDVLAGTTSFAASTHSQRKAPSFKGIMQAPQYMFERSRLTRMLDFIRKIDGQQYKIYEEIIATSLKNNKLIENMPTGSRSLNTILSEANISNVPLGENKTFTTRFVNGFFSPVTFVKDTVTGLYGSVKKLVSGETKIDIESLKANESFQSYYKERLKLPVWATSNLEDDEIMLKLYKEFKSRIAQNKFDANGVKNLILTLEKRYKAEGIDITSPEAASLEKAKEIFNKILTKADGANHTEYDANSIAQLNINLSRAISTIFLVTDSYNLTMQYSNNDKKEAIKTAKNRTAQEVSRIASSAYIMAFTHRIISKVYNGSLLGAFGTVLLTSTASDSLARAVVGVPIFRKSQAELIELEEKQKETKNPIQKTLAYLIGKKVN